MWPSRTRSPEYQELVEITKSNFRWRPLLTALPVWVVFAKGMHHLEASGIHTVTDLAWLIGSGVALVAAAFLWWRSDASLDEVSRRVNREATALSFPILIFLLFAFALVDAAFKFPSRIDGDSIFYLIAFGTLWIHAGAWTIIWRRYFPNK